jgi:hypothetical protein
LSLFLRLQTWGRAQFEMPRTSRRRGPRYACSAVKGASCRQWGDEPQTSKTCLRWGETQENVAQGSLSSLAAFPPRRGVGGAAPQNSDCLVCGAGKARTAGKAAGPERGPCATRYNRPISGNHPEFVRNCSLSVVRGPLSARWGHPSAGSAKRTSVKDQALRGFY